MVRLIVIYYYLSIHIFQKKKKTRIFRQARFWPSYFSCSLLLHVSCCRKNNWWKQWRYSCGPIPSLSGKQIWPLSYLLLPESTAWVACSEYSLYLGPITEASQGRIMKHYLPCRISFIILKWSRHSHIR